MRLGAILTFDPETEARFESMGGAIASLGIVGEQTKGIPYHITLALWEDSPEARELMSSRSREAARAFAPFTVRFRHIGLFGLRVLFLAPREDAPLMGLRVVFEPDRGDWEPHATLLIDSAECALRALPAVAERFEGLDATAAAIEVCEFFPTRLISRERLGGA